MKKYVCLLALTITATLAHAGGKVVPLDMKFGYWESKSAMIESEAMRSMLASIPKEQQAQVRAMMDSKMQSRVTKQCYTADTFDRFEEKIKSAYGGEANCAFTVINSTSKVFDAEIVCSGHATQIHTKVINPKRQESEVTTAAEGMGDTKITIVAEWVADQCPAGVTAY